MNGNKVVYLYKPKKENFEKAKKCLKEIQKIVKDKNIPYIPSEKMADLLKDRDLNENFN
ncbi:hypothetical protein [Succinivibrio dextrinosolvens]|jgi:hypothetical protein|uniref:hypothetical protein n=1 Tax=Succinivibrio dextrinosolvens TaxID=83771 RepID=UPI00241C6325|nr:hypothetical protein [Succinivibrio dextrinosolvens]